MNDDEKMKKESEFWSLMFLAIGAASFLAQLIQVHVVYERNILIVTSVVLFLVSLFSSFIVLILTSSCLLILTSIFFFIYVGCHVCKIW